MSRSSRDRLNQFLLFVLFFIGAALLLFFKDAYVRLAPDLQQVEPYYYWENFQGYLMGGITGGILVAAFEIYLLKNLFNRYGMLVLTLGRALFFLVVYVFVTVFFSFVYNISVLEKGPLDPEVRAQVFEHLTGPVPTIDFVFYGVFITILVFFHQIIDLVGRGVLGKFLFGRYKVPRVIHRTFLFMDMNASTAIAEKVGHVDFFALMQDFLSEAGKEIREFGGEINKYVGDEIIAVWDIDGGARRAEALQCLLAITQRMKDKAAYFEEKYGVVPDFKAGIHCGDAMVGELGDWKREVAYMGDTLNTTARIQGACKKLGARILISDVYYKLIIDDTRYSVEYAGRGRLRGRAEPVALYRVLTDQELDARNRADTRSVPE